MTSRTHLAPQPHFSRKLLSWFDKHGRHDLPWQKNRTAYRVWVSEIMLQQTQVATVIPYFAKFMAQFPNIHTLGAASIDDVLALWTGLGYYSRARNLHRCAQQVVTQWQGNFPDQLEALIQLPGIGRSTAAAIISQAFNQPAAILDGNVKRVLTRIYGIEGWPGQAHIEKKLWQLAESLMPTTRNADYTQAIMDLGATICKRNKPLCVACPMQDTCSALATNKTSSLPNRKPKRELPTKQTWMLLLVNHNHQILLHQRPSQGIWGGLWSLLEFSDLAALNNHIALLGVAENTIKYAALANADANQLLTKLPTINHAFSHYKLNIHPIKMMLPANHGQVMADEHSQWVGTSDIEKIGLPGPIKKLIYQYWKGVSLYKASDNQ